MLNCYEILDFEMYKSLANAIKLLVFVSSTSFVPIFSTKFFKSPLFRVDKLKYFLTTYNISRKQHCLLLITFKVTVILLVLQKLSLVTILTLLKVQVTVIFLK